MEFTKAQIAGLILGYLRSEKCMTAYQEVLKSSPHLSEALQVIQKGKYFVTRVSGLSLEDILHEYANIYTIVQGHLEASTYYEENHRTNSLVDQVNYLLDKRSDGPVTSSPLHSLQRPYCEDKGTDTNDICEIDATPSLSLPGNTPYCEDKEKSFKTVKRKDMSHNQKLHKNVEDVPNATLNDESGMVLTQTLLDHTELHEKLAETINTVLNNPNEDLTDGASKELDATIKTVVQKTEEDPIFTRLLNEIIGIGVIDQGLKNKPSTSEGANSSKSYDTSSVCSEKASQDKSETNKNDGNIEAVNNDAIQSIIAVSNSAETDSENYNNYLKASSTPSIGTQNPIYLNTGGVYVVPTTNPTSTSKQFYVLNSQPVLNMPINAAPLITEQDIMTMPTVIVEGVATSSSMILSVPTSQSSQKPAISVSSMASNVAVSEAITLYGTNTDSNEVQDKEQPKTKSQRLLVPKITPTLLETKPEKKFTKAAKKSSTSKQYEQVLSPISKTPDVKQNSKGKSPKSGSHVRNLDFSTPPKSKDRKIMKTSRKYVTPSKKRLFSKISDAKSSGKSPARKCPKQSRSSQPRKSWDADLRTMIVTEDKGSVPKVPRKNNSSKGKKKIDNKNKEKLNVTTEEGRLLEAALKTPIKCEDVEMKDVDDNDSSKLKGEKSDGDQDDSIELIEDSITDTRDRIVIDNEVKVKYSLRNCNSGPKFKRKCNIGPSNVTSTSNSDIKKEQVVSVLKREKKPPDDTDTTNKLLLLSPTKLNANKRNLVNTDTYEPDLQCDDNSISPETVSEISVETVITKRNITPLLETPIKTIPKTPCIQSCLNSTVTPFSKVIEEHLKGVDLASLSTPRIPLTPNFPLTPSVGLLSSTYPDRPTDYSTSSSYYQPSDSEQNKSLEQILIEESQRLAKVENRDKKDIKILSDIVIETPVTEEDKMLSDTERKLSEHLKNFNQSVIGKKNLNLVKQNIVVSSSSSEDSTDCSDSESSCDDQTWTNTEDGDPVIQNIVHTVACNYSLRTRPLVEKHERKDSTEEAVSDVVKESIIKNNEITSSQKSVLLEMEEKRKRTISKLTSNPVSVSKKSADGTLKRVMPTRDAKGKFLSKRGGQTPKQKKITPSRTRSKTVSKKTSTPPVLKSLKKTEFLNMETENTDEDIVLHLSSDDDTIQPSHLVETQILEFSNSSMESAANKKVGTENEGTLSDQEAEKLVKELKERGIHLMLKKSPGKQKLEAIAENIKTHNLQEFKVDKNSKQVPLEPASKKLSTQKLKTNEAFIVTIDTNKTIDDKKCKKKDTKDETADSKAKQTSFAKHKSKVTETKENTIEKNVSESKSKNGENKDFASEITKSHVPVKCAVSKSYLTDLNSESSQKKDSHSDIDKLFSSEDHQSDFRTKSDQNTDSITEINRPLVSENCLSDLETKSDQKQDSLSRIDKLFIPEGGQSVLETKSSFSLEDCQSDIKTKRDQNIDSNTEINRPVVPENCLPDLETKHDQKQDPISTIDKLFNPESQQSVIEAKGVQNTDSNAEVKKPFISESTVSTLGSESGQNNSNIEIDKLSTTESHQSVLEAKNDQKVGSDIEANKSPVSENRLSNLEIKNNQNKVSKQETNKLSLSESCLSDLDVSFNANSEVTFDLKSYKSEDCTFTYNEKEKHKTLEDYNLALVNKCISANVYLEELDMEMTRKIMCTPFATLLDIPAVGIQSETQPLANEVTENTDQTEITSFENKMEVVKVESVKVDVAAHSDIQSSKSLIENMEIVDGLIVSNLETQSPVADRSEDELMNYALVGSFREENEDEYSISPKSAKKRKATNKDESKHPEKKIKTEKCKTLLKALDVETFLNKVHGGKNS